MLVAMVAAGPHLAEVTASTIPATELAGAFDVAFLSCMLPGIAGILLMLAVRERELSGEAGGEATMGF